jgi:hypothetical protein
MFTTGIAMLRRPTMERKQSANFDLEVETRPFLGAGVLVGVGGLVAFVGVIVGCLHARSEGLRLIGRMETPPNELARAKMNQAVAAATAGANAWKRFDPTSTHSAAS